MDRKLFALLIFIGVTLLNSCNSIGEHKETKNKLALNKTMQKDDGTIALEIDKAACYSDMVHPSSNTAEWDVVVSKTGRYNVWMRSSTKDTTNLKYQNPVMVSIQDNRLEAHPGCDKIVANSSDVSLPYYRADSYIGSLFIQDTGLLNIQVISEKIVPRDYKSTGSSDVDNSKLISLFLTPITP